LFVSQLVVRECRAGDTQAAEARLEVAENKEQRVAILTEWVEAMKEQEGRVQKSFAAGILAQPLDLYATKYMRLEAELRLAKARAE